MDTIFRFLPLSPWVLQSLFKKYDTFKQKHPNLTSVFQDGFEGFLNIRDSRTGCEYRIPIVNNAVNALNFKDIVPVQNDTNEKAGTAQGLRVFDPGYRNTAVKSSSITFIDAHNGLLKYRNHSIDDMAGNKTYEDIAHLLIFGRLPTKDEAASIKLRILGASTVPETVVSVIKSFPRDALPPIVVMAGMAAFATTDKNAIPSYVGDNLYCGKMKAVDEQIFRTIWAYISTVCITFCHSQGIEFTQPDPSLSIVENILLMTGKVDKATGRPSPKHVDILNKLSVLFSDHEMTCSTAAFLHTTSTLADPLTSTLSGLSTGYGLLHGGAIPVAYKSMKDLGDVSKVPELIEKVKAKKVRLFGYGHRMYRTADPRSKYCQEILQDLIADGQQVDPVIEIALEIDRIASQDEYFVSRNLFANADLFGCLIYIALGYPPDFCICLAQCFRLLGVMAQWRESMERPPVIWRPQQLYVGK